MRVSSGHAVRCAHYTRFVRDEEQAMTAVRSLTVLDFGRADIDLGRVMAPGDLDGQWAVCAFPGYLFELTDGRRVLVDNGPNRRHIREPMYEYVEAGSDLGNYLKPRLTDADDPRNRLAELGLTTDDIDILVLTHTHFDHAGNTADFTSSRIIIHADALEFGRQRYEQGQPGSVPDLGEDGAPLDYETFTGDYEIADGLTLLETPSHAPGHVSILARLPETGTIILAIDAIYSQVNRDRSNYQSGADPAVSRRSAERLIALAEAENALLVYGHDPAQWTELRKAPEVYR
jgi:N-acyl homoserine lactone hydrolase